MYVPIDRTENDPLTWLTTGNVSTHGIRCIYTTTHRPRERQPMFIHHSEHYTAPHRHELVSEARECEAEAAYAAAWEAAHDAPTCSLCDAVGHGYPGGGPCPLEVNEIARYEDDLDEMRAAALGLSFA